MTRTSGESKRAGDRARSGSRIVAILTIQALVTVSLVVFAVNADAAATCRGKRATIVGTDGADNLAATSGTDIIFAGKGDDTIIGSGDLIDDDRFCGGDGDDRFLGPHGTQVMDGGAGTDLVSFAGGGRVEAILGSALDPGTATGIKKLFSIENIEGSAANDTLAGGPGPNVITGGDGDDFFIWHPADTGNDSYDAGAGTGDWAVFTRLTGPIAVDLAAGTASGSETGADTVAGFERIVGSFFDDSLAGSDQSDELMASTTWDSYDSDMLVGRGGNDIFQGSNGDNTYDGGEGDDNLGGMTGADGGYGADRFTGGPGDDWFTHIARAGGVDNGGGDIIQGDGGRDVLSGGTGNDQIFGGEGIDNLVGSSGNDQLMGEGDVDNLGARDAAESGNDTLLGGEGVDSFVGGHGVDSCPDADPNTEFVDQCQAPGRDDNASGELPGALDPVPQSDIAVALTGPEPVEGTSEALFTATVTNNGPADADFGATLQVYPGARIVKAPPSSQQAECGIQGDGRVTAAALLGREHICFVRTLSPGQSVFPAGQSVAFEFTVDAADAALMTGIAVAYPGTSLDPNPDNNTITMPLEAQTCPVRRAPTRSLQESCRTVTLTGPFVKDKQVQFVERGEEFTLTAKIAPCKGNERDDIDLLRAVAGVFGRLKTAASNDQCIAKFATRIRKDTDFKARLPEKGSQPKAESTSMTVKVR